jgi:serine protease Do
MITSTFLRVTAAALGSAFLLTPAFAETLKERQAKVSAAVAKTRDAVVCITSRGAGMGSGSGVIVSKDGLVLTAAHVVEAAGSGDEKKDVAVILPDGTEVKGKVLGLDLNRDAAMVQIEDSREWPFAEPAPADSVEKGEWCIAMGHPGGFDIQRGAPVRLGRLWQDNEKAFYRSDCTVSGGDSGGPLFDLDGRVIGIHSNISMDVAENRHVPIGVFHKEWDRLKKGDVWGNSKRLLAGSDDLRPRGQSQPGGQRRSGPREPSVPERQGDDKPAAPAKGGAWLGLALDQSDEAVTAGEIVENSPADKAGLQRGDVILKVNGKSVGSTGDIIGRVRDAAPGDTLKLTVKRGGEEKELEVTLGAKE